MSSISVEKFSRKTLISLGIACIVYICLVYFLSGILPGVAQIHVTAEIDHPDTFQLFYWNGFREIEFQEKYSVRSKQLPQHAKTKVVFKFDNAPANKIRLDLGDSGGIVKIHSIAVGGYLARTVVFDPSDIYRLFKPGSDDVQFRLEKNYVEIVSQSDDPHIVSTKPIYKASRFLAYGLPLIFAVALFTFLRHLNFNSFPAFQDIVNKQPSTGGKVEALDGLRGLAALMVVADHTHGRLLGLGASGVWIFMTLSGFLLARPFVYNPERVFSKSYLIHFFSRRVRRIVPIYYLYIIAIYLLTKHFDVAIRHFLFLQGDGHLWVVPQEMLFYLLVPGIMVVNLILFRIKPVLAIVNLLFMAVLANQLLDYHVIALYGMARQKLCFFIGVFLIGILFSYLYYSTYNSSGLKNSNKARSIFSASGIALILFFLLGSSSYLWGGHHIFAQEYFQWFSYAAGLLVFCIMASNGTTLEKILCFLPLRALGLVSLSLYLLHPLVLQIINKGILFYTGNHPSELLLFFSTLCVSYLIACVTYTYIERPFLS
jgi:peptidoglycan/LPS O-acetylase OafA/YrhL